MEDAIRDRFAQQTRLLRIVSVFALLSLLVAALGLFAMSSYYLQQERRTVALKKVYGADYDGVLRELVFSFLKLIGISFVLAVPLAALVMRKWLDTFSYHIDLHAWIFLAAGAAVALLAALSVLWQSFRAARTNPAEELKKEELNEKLPEIPEPQQVLQKKQLGEYYDIQKHQASGAPLSCGGDVELRRAGMRIRGLFVDLPAGRLRTVV